MKSLYYILSSMLVISASLHAMDVTIEKFDYSKHGKQAIDIFKKTMSSNSGIPCDLKANADPAICTIDVAIGYKKITRKRCKETVLGLIMHNIKTYKFGKDFKNFLGDKRVKSFKKENPQLLKALAVIKKKHIWYLCVDPEHQRKGYGRMLLNEAEKHAEKEQCNLIELFPLADAEPFYVSLGYLKKNLDVFDYTLAKPLDSNVAAILNTVTHILNKEAMKDTPEDC